MYELYFGDETTMPCENTNRFRNFQKIVQEVKSQRRVPAPPQPNLDPIPEIILPEEVIDALEEKDITETPFIFMRSNMSSKISKGEAYAIGYDEFLVIMWRTGDEYYKLVKIEHYDVIDVSGGVEEDDDSIIVLMISTEERTYSLWFSDSQSDELVTFINSWKYHQIHQIGGKTDISFDVQEDVAEGRRS